MIASQRKTVLLERTVVIIAVIIALLPFIWLALTAYKPPKDIFSVPPSILFTPTWANFEKIFSLFDVPALMMSSLKIAGTSAVLSLLFGVPAGYALARSKSKYAMGLAYFFMAIRMVPAAATLIPFYLMMRDIGLLGHWISVSLINTTLNASFVTWMMFSYFRGLPKELEEAAMTDGCTQFGAFFRVALPAVRPGIIAAVMFCILFSWNDFLYGMFLTRLQDKPISVALLSAYGTKDINWGTLGALAHFSTIPIVVIVLGLNRYFVQGLTRGVH